MVCFPILICKQNRLQHGHLGGFLWDLTKIRPCTHIGFHGFFAEARFLPRCRSRKPRSARAPRRKQAAAWTFWNFSVGTHKIRQCILPHGGILDFHAIFADSKFLLRCRRQNQSPRTLVGFRYGPSARASPQACKTMAQACNRKRHSTTYYEESDKGPSSQIQGIVKSDRYDS